MNKSIFIGRMATDPKVMSSAGKKGQSRIFGLRLSEISSRKELRMLITLAVSHLGERAEFVAKYF
mgnify:CR=1 FL=1